MARLLIATLFVILPVVFSEEQGKSLPVEYGQPSAIAATGALGANYGQQSASSETHDKKNFGLNFSSDKGSTNQMSNTQLQAAATGGLAQGQGTPYSPYYGYPQYPYYYPQVYPQYPVYPNYGLGVGSPSVGVGSQVQVPGVSAGSVAGVAPGSVGGQYPIRY